MILKSQTFDSSSTPHHKYWVLHRARDFGVSSVERSGQWLRLELERGISEDALSKGPKIKGEGLSLPLFQFIRVADH